MFLCRVGGGEETARALSWVAVPSGCDTKNQVMHFGATRSFNLEYRVSTLTRASEKWKEHGASSKVESEAFGVGVILSSRRHGLF